MSIRIGWKRAAIVTTVPILALGAIATPASAVEIWAVDNLGTTNAGTVGDRVIRFDSANPTGTVVTVGATGVASTLMSGLDFMPTGTLYAVSQPAAGGGNLYTISQVNGQATVVGALGIPSGTQMTDLSYNPVTGMMQGVSFTGTGNVHQIWNINVGNGAATSIGTVTGLPGSPVNVGMATNAAGTIFLHDVISDRMYSLDGSFAATGLPSTIGVDTNFSQGMTMDWRSNDEWYLGAIGPAAPPFFSDVRLINNATGATQQILGVWPTAGTGLPQYELGDLAIIPEPAALSLLSLAAVGMLRRRRSA